MHVLAVNFLSAAKTLERALLRMAAVETTRMIPAAAKMIRAAGPMTLVGETLVLTPLQSAVLAR